MNMVEYYELKNLFNKEWRSAGVRFPPQISTTRPMDSQEEAASEEKGSATISSGAETWVCVSSRHSSWPKWWAVGELGGTKRNAICRDRGVPVERSASGDDLDTNGEAGKECHTNVEPVWRSRAKASKLRLFFGILSRANALEVAGGNLSFITW